MQTVAAICNHRPFSGFSHPHRQFHLSFRAKPPSPSAAAKTNTGFIAAGAGPTSSIKASSNMPISRSYTATGPNSSSRSRSPKAKSIPPPCALWPLSGSASCSSAGATASPMMKPLTSTASNAEAHRSLINSNSNFPKPPESAVNNFTQNICRTTSDVWLGVR